jgi:pimeloyl-ACP methyl ester carboxylesterase
LRLNPKSIADDLYRRLPCIHSSQRIILVGHSLGALVAIELVHRYNPNGQIILIDPPLWPCGDKESQLEAQRALANDNVGRRLLIDSFGSFDGSIT